MSQVPAPVPTAEHDPFAWLEEVDGERAMAWVREQNARTVAGLAATPAFERTRAQVLEVLDSPARLPEVSLIGDLLYNFWRDAEHPRGLWRRTTPQSYRTDSPDWQTVLDVDALNAAEGEDWVWHGASVLRPTQEGQPWRHALVELSHGGSDADVTRELDLVTLSLVDPADGGFLRPEAKGGVSWVDADTVLVFTDLGEGTTTTSGYPRTVRRWRRGTPLADAEPVYCGEPDDVYVSGRHDHTPGFARDFVERAVTFFTDELYLVRPDGGLTLVDVPASAQAGVHREWLLVRLREPWAPDGGAVHPAGSLLAARFEDYLAGSREVEVLFAPTQSAALHDVTWTRHHLVLTVLADVRHRLEVLTPPEHGVAGWGRRELSTGADLATVSVRAVDRVTSDDLWLTLTDYLTPTTLLVVGAAPGGRVEQLKAAPSFFDPTGLTISQHRATSQDGTVVPYFQVARDDLTLDGTAPTLLYGYGGFEVSLTPGYSGGVGRAWLSEGGVYVVANIRGGGEFGPDWHRAALREHRHRAYQDFAAVAADLTARGVTRPQRLAVQGGSNGGLLTGNMLTGYPELVGAVVIQVPLLDMRRYPHLLAGASWMEEYGDPDDPDQWTWIRTFSPYHLLDASRDYPPVLLTTSTRDDRVHPGHARKLAAWLLAAGKDVTYYENVEGGHGGAADNAQAAFMAALAYRFCWERLG